MSDDEKPKDFVLAPGECTLRIVPVDAWVTLVSEPPLAAVPLEPDQARTIARRLRQCADKVEDMQRAKRTTEESH